MKNSRTAKWITIPILLYCCYYTDPNFSQAAEQRSTAFVSLKESPGYQTVVRECTVCHSEKLITQNRATRAGWIDTIRWMQKTQNLRAFSAEEEKTILDYLASHYGPRAFGRRPPLDVQEWYDLRP